MNYKLTPNTIWYGIYNTEYNAFIYPYWFLNGGQAEDFMRSYYNTLRQQELEKYPLDKTPFNTMSEYISQSDIYDEINNEENNNIIYAGAYKNIKFDMNQSNRILVYDLTTELKYQYINDLLNAMNELNHN